jgi:predicted O-linked N-acetylglucosamine transferase (SPINDLY family)
MGNNEEALRSYDAALQIDPGYQEVLLNSGALLRSMFRHKEALERFNKILTINPSHVAALGNCGIMLTEFKQSKQAIAMFEQLIKINPDFDFGLGLLFYEQMHICDWSGHDTLGKQILDGVRAGRRVCKSLALMSLSDEASDHQIAAQTFAAHHNPGRATALWQGERYRHKKIRLAYVSPDLREHPVGHLMAGILEQHDKSRFETIAISLGIDDQSRLRARMLMAFDQFIDARDMSTAQIAKMMREMEVDIAVDLGGYTSDTRTAIFSYRPAPVQVNYLGYPGTLGTEYFDYILADRHIIPPEQQHFYDERVVYMPDTYLPTDNSVQISPRTPSRNECGLPEIGVVFCSFSHDYKISPPVFDVWMRLLTQVPGSVLWLMSRGELAQGNLRKEAVARGVDPSRLVFAGRVPLVEDHLARYRQADVFLDTHPYNAHTTAADALMAGLPVVTYMGHSFPSRVAGSLLHAIGVPELVTHSLQDYEALALKLALEPALLASIKGKIAANRASHPIFDTEDFCFHLESTYMAMWRTQHLGNTTDELGVQCKRF